jgi:hypothetical protein
MENRILILVVALFLMTPLVAHAGSANSRWDMTLGGFTVFDVVYNTKAQGVDVRLSPVNSKGGVDNPLASTGSLAWAAGGTRLNWAVKGPEAWTAKTGAFVEADFRGRAGGTEYGLFHIRHAYFQMIWPQTKILIGHTWQAWGTIPSLMQLSFPQTFLNIGANRVPQIRVTQALTKNFTGVFALQAPYFVEDFILANGNMTNDAMANGQLPDVVLDFSYASDACGKIGPWGLKVGLGGFYSRDKYLLNEASTTAAPRYITEMLDRWGAGLYWYLPIIPEKKMNKAGSLGFTGQLFAGQGMAGYLPAYSVGGNPNAYLRNVNGVSIPLPTITGFTSSNVINMTDSGGVDMAYPRTQGGWVQVTFYFTDKLFTNAIYGAQYNKLSKAYISGNRTSIVNGISLTSQMVPERFSNLIVNIMYDVSPAIRFGVEYAKITTAYAYKETPTLANKGDIDSVRFGAYYFF